MKILSTVLCYVRLLFKPYCNYIFKASRSGFKILLVTTPFCASESEDNQSVWNLQPSLNGYLHHRWQTMSDAALAYTGQVDSCPSMPCSWLRNPSCPRLSEGHQIHLRKSLVSVDLEIIWPSPRCTTYMMCETVKCQWRKELTV